jgi:hypothetical protein
MDFNLILSNIDWLFAGIILVGGRYWGSKYFKISKNPDINFLVFATLFGAMWILIQGATEANFSSLFITYLFTTSFYQLLAKKFFAWVERLAGLKDDLPQPDSSGPGGGTNPPPPPPPPPPGN